MQSAVHLLCFEAVGDGDEPAASEQPLGEENVAELYAQMFGDGDSSDEPAASEQSLGEEEVAELHARMRRLKTT